MRYVEQVRVAGPSDCSGRRDTDVIAGFRTLDEAGNVTNVLERLALVGRHLTEAPGG